MNVVVKTHIDEQLDLRLEREARKWGISKSGLVRRIIVQHLEQRDLLEYGKNRRMK